MKILIRSATVFQPGSAFHQKTTDILVESGLIAAIGTAEPDSDTRVLDAEGCMLSTGWVDGRATLCDPGHEDRETLTSGCMAAARGGFVAVACTPFTNPVVDGKSVVEYIRRQAENELVKVWPIGGISKGLRGEDLAELFDMHISGAVAFADHGTKSGMMLRALQYCQTFGGIVYTTPDDKNISSGGRMHEGFVNVGLGLKGIPAMAETIALKRDLDLLRYAGGRLHVSKVSTAESVQLIRQAKAEGLSITADVTIHHLCHTDSELETFDTQFKHFPPLRSSEHVEALLAGVSDGTIDAIVTDHCPQTIETKAVEFEYASAGCIGLQQLFSMYCTCLADTLSLDRFIACVTLGSREILNCSMPEIRPGEPACFTVFHPTETWVLNEETNASLSGNSPWFGKQMWGLVRGVMNGDKHLWFGK